MKYEDHLKRMKFEFVEERLDGFGDRVSMYQLKIDGRPIGCVMTWDKANRTRAWLASALADLEELFRSTALPGAARPDDQAIPAWLTEGFDPLARGDAMSSPTH